MAFDYINEAFKRLSVLEEETFNVTHDGIKMLDQYVNDGDVDPSVRVIDLDAKTEEDLKDSYVGKIIINCNICHSHVFEDKQNIEINEDGNVNAETPCPYCGEQEGFCIIGEIAPFTNTTTESEEDDKVPADQDADDQPTDQSPAVKEMDENLSTRGSRATHRAKNISEDFKEVSISTEDQHLEMHSDENGKVTVVTEPITNTTTAAETIVPVSDETANEIIENNTTEDEPAEELPADDTDSTIEDDSVSFEFDEFDEDSMNELGESYLRNVYDNVKSFKTTSIASNDSCLIVEGIISFDSGVQKKTGFLFEANDCNDRGQVRFTGYNKQLTESKDAYSLIGRVDNKKLFVESLKYNYVVSNTPVRGIVRKR